MVLCFANIFDTPRSYWKKITFSSCSISISMTQSDRRDTVRFILVPGTYVSEPVISVVLSASNQDISQSARSNKRKMITPDPRCWSKVLIKVADQMCRQMLPAYFGTLQSVYGDWFLWQRRMEYSLHPEFAYPNRYLILINLMLLIYWTYQAPKDIPIICERYICMY